MRSLGEGALSEIDLKITLRGVDSFPDFLAVIARLNALARVVGAGAKTEVERGEHERDRP